jgi:Tn3 transposase DDE domain
LGRIPKTLYLLAYIDDESYRRRILTQLNRGESRHSVARAVFHGPCTCTLRLNTPGSPTDCHRGKKA